MNALKSDSWLFVEKISLFQWRLKNYLIFFPMQPEKLFFQQVGPDRCSYCDCVLEEILYQYSLKNKERKRKKNGVLY